MAEIRTVFTGDTSALERSANKAGMAVDKIGKQTSTAGMNLGKGLAALSGGSAEAIEKLNQVGMGVEALGVGGAKVSRMLGNIGALGAAAMAGWGVGRLIAQITGLDDAMAKFYANLDRAATRSQESIDKTWHKIKEIRDNLAAGRKLADETRNMSPEQEAKRQLEKELGVGGVKGQERKLLTASEQKLTNEAKQEIIAKRYNQLLEERVKKITNEREIAKAIAREETTIIEQARKRELIGKDQFALARAAVEEEFKAATKGTITARERLAFEETRKLKLKEIDKQEVDAIAKKMADEKKLQDDKANKEKARMEALADMAKQNHIEALQLAGKEKEARIEAINQEYDKRAEAMKKIGATAEQLAELEANRQKKLNEDKNEALKKQWGNEIIRGWGMNIKGLADKMIAAPKDIKKDLQEKTNDILEKIEQNTSDSYSPVW